MEPARPSVQSAEGEQCEVVLLVLRHDRRRFDGLVARQHRLDPCRRGGDVVVRRHQTFGNHEPGARADLLPRRSVEPKREHRLPGSAHQLLDGLPGGRERGAETEGDAERDRLLHVAIH